MQVVGPEDEARDESTEEGAQEPAASPTPGEGGAEDQQDTRYRAYLLRCWQEGASWRYSVETAGEVRQRQGFGSLESLLAWLGAEFEAVENSEAQLRDLEQVDEKTGRR